VELVNKPKSSSSSAVSNKGLATFLPDFDADEDDACPCPCPCCGVDSKDDCRDFVGVCLLCCDGDVMPNDDVPNSGSNGRLLFPFVVTACFFDADLLAEVKSANKSNASSVAVAAAAVDGCAAAFCVDDDFTVPFDDNVEALVNTSN